MNIKLIRVFQFSNQFNLNMRYKSSKDYIISNVLSRFASTNVSTLSSDHFELNVLYVYNATLIKMFDNFRNKLIENYSSNSAWKKILATIIQNEQLDENAIHISFFKHFIAFESDFYMKSRSYESNENLILISYQFEKNLIYHINDIIDLRRLCVFQSCINHIFKIAHENDHSDFIRCFQIISRAWFIRNLSKQLRTYIKHCFECFILQIRKHSSYENLQSIESSSMSFHIITLNFILALFESLKHYDTIMFVTDKFIKRIILIFEKNTFKVLNWALSFFERFDITDWKYFKIIITDRNRKFLFELWKVIFNRLEIHLLYSTSYYSQTDDFNERTNQTTKVALKFYIHELKIFFDWSRVLSRFQTLINNAYFAATDKFSNEIVYEFTLNKSLNLLVSKTIVNHERIEIANAISWANMKYKYHYDRKHTSMFLKKEDWALIKLHKKYSISFTLKITKKLTQQFVESFEIIQRIDRLVYKLKISINWKIHFVFFIAQLKSSNSFDSNFYDRFKSTNFSFVFVESDTDQLKFYEIDRLLNKRTIKKEKKRSIEYLMRWKKYDSKWNRWYNIKNLEDADDLIKKYDQALKSK